MNLKFTSDKIDDIKHMYEMIRQAIDVGCGTAFLLPDIEHKNEVPNFFEALVPDSTHKCYFSILGSYRTISNSLLTFFVRLETVTTCAPEVSQAIEECKTSSDRFVYLGTILYRLLPQFERRPLNLIDEISKLCPINGEDILDFHKRTLSIQTSLKLSRMSVPPTLFFHTYLNQLNKCEDICTNLTVYNRDFAKHLRDHGDKIPFPENIQDVYDYLKESERPRTIAFKAHLVSSKTKFPSASYAPKGCHCCEYCEKFHDEDNCHHKGFAFMPSS